MAAAYGVAATYGREAVIHMASIGARVHTHTSERYADTVFAAWEQIADNADATYIEDPADVLSYKSIPDSGAQHLQLSGYFQQEGYFSHCSADFAKKLILPDAVPILYQTCFIHLRYGDYMSHAAHCLELTGKYLPEAMRLQRERHPGVQFLVFSDDIGRCKECLLLRASDVAFSEETNEVIALVQLSKCWIGGICSNSTFSWWGAYLNANPNRVVTFPRKWMNSNIKTHIQFAGSILLSHE